MSCCCRGPDSALTRKLVKERGYTDEVSGGINLLGNMFNYKGPDVVDGRIWCTIQNTAPTPYLPTSTQPSGRSRISP